MRSRPIVAAAALLAGAVPAQAEGVVIGGEFSRTGADVTPRFFHAASRLSGTNLVMVTGGMRVQIFPPSLVSQASVSFFNPDLGEFSALYAPRGGGPTVSPSLLIARSSHTQTLLPDGRVLVTGGHVGAAGTSPGIPTTGVEIFDPLSGAFVPGPPMNEARAAHTATLVVDGRVLVAGGSSAQLFDPSMSAWGAPIALSVARSAHAAALVETGAGSRVLLAGGAGGAGTTLELVDFMLGSSSMLPGALTVGVDDLACAVLDDGRVLITGGQNVSSGDTVALTYLFDPITLSLAAIDPVAGFAAGVSDHRMVVLGGSALVAGGESQVAGNDTELSQSALFARECDGWVWTGSMSHPHDDAAAVALEDGRILVIGGGAPFLGQEIATAECEIFTAIHAPMADLSCDGVVGFDDLLIILSAWGSCGAGPCDADLNGDHEIGFDDLLIVLSSWG